MPGAFLIIPVHNRRETTLACLRHLRGLGILGRFGCIVVDDGSSDGTARHIREELPEITILTGDGNLWWTGGVALGSHHAFAQGATAVIWLNDDCHPLPGTLDRLLTVAREHPDAVVAPACIDSCDGHPVPTGFKGRRAISAHSGEILPVNGLSGFCVLVPRSVWEQLGPPDARRFPHYAGDIAYTLQAGRRGFRLLLVGDVQACLRDHHPQPKSPAALRPGLGWKADYRAVFLNNKSPFRLATQWHWLRLKYGMLPGSVLAACRGLAWHLRFVLRF